jgi:SAM-dependent methyltransferase
MNDKKIGITNPRAFWNKKILAWEAGRYGNGTQKNKSLLEKIADRSSQSLRFRQRVGVELISKQIEGRNIVELGCGSGISAEAFIGAGASGYRGFDISDIAIAAALERNEKYVISGIAGFEVATVESLPDFDRNAIIVSFGLLDWLNDIELESLFKNQGARDYMHSISEKRHSLSQILHRLYVQLAYGHRTSAYIPRYFQKEEITGLTPENDTRPTYIYRDARLAFGALISTFPMDQKISRAGK